MGFYLEYYHKHKRYLSFFSKNIYIWQAAFHELHINGMSNVAWVMFEGRYLVHNFLSYCQRILQVSEYPPTGHSILSAKLDKQELEDLETHHSQPNSCPYYIFILLITYQHELRTQIWSVKLQNHINIRSRSAPTILELTPCNLSLQPKADISSSSMHKYQLEK